MKVLISGIVFFIFTMGSFGQIVNEGQLTIKDGTTVYFGEEYTNKSGATHTNEGDLYLNSNFINDGTVSLSADADTANGVTYFDSPTNANSVVNTIQTISGTNSVVFENMVVNLTDAGAIGVTVADQLELVVEKGLTLTSGDLRLLDRAQLVQLHTGSNQNSGTTNLLKDQQGTTVVYDYNYWSSPVSGSVLGQYQLGEVLFDGSDSSLNPFTPTLATYSTGSPWNGTPSVLDGSGNVITPLNLESYWIYKFDNGDIDDDNDWILMRNNTAFEAGLGFTLKGAGASTANQNYVFKGKPNDGDYSFAIGANKSYLLGNPYPSAMDADDFITENSAVLADVTIPSATTGAIYYWEHWGGGSHSQSDYQGGYATYTLAGGTPPTSHPDVNGGGTSSGINGSRYIPVAQGFFVESNTGGSIVINNSQRTFKLEDGSSSFFRRDSPNEEEINDTTPRIRLGYHSPSGFYRQIMTAFIDECNDGHNTAYDARMADVGSSDMFWVTNNTPYVIDARPYGIEKQIPIGINVQESGIQKIFLFEAENFDGDIYILDTETQYTYNIRQNDFEIDLDQGQYLDRFKLVFLPSSPLAVSDLELEGINATYIGNWNEILINNPNKVNLLEASVFNSLGQLIYAVDDSLLGNNEQIKIPFKVAEGTYFVYVKSTAGKGSFKILVY